MNIDINIISNPFVISADKARELAKPQYNEAEAKVDKKTILDYIRTKPWINIRQRAKEGNTSYIFTIGFDERNDCHVREKYGWVWLQKEGAQFITDLFTSVGYKIQIRQFARFLRFDIAWAD